MPDKAEHLRALHHGPPIFVVPNAWDAATARLFEAEGFPAVATTSAGVAAALGYPDGGVVPAREMIEAVARIARSVSVPVTADIEHAYAASPSAVADVVLRVVAAGAMPSSYRFNKAKKAEWIKAVAEGREEQLRIENWMKDAAHTSQSTGGPR